MSEAIIDRARLEQICMGNLELVRELIDSLIDESTPLIDQLGHQVAARDAAAVRKTAHSIKGIAGTVGAQRLQVAALDLEHGIAENAAWDAVESRLAGIVAALTELRAERARTL